MMPKTLACPIFSVSKTNQKKFGILTENALSTITLGWKEGTREGEKEKVGEEEREGGKVKRKEKREENISEQTKEGKRGKSCAFQTSLQP